MSSSGILRAMADADDAMADASRLGLFYWLAGIYGSGYGTGGGDQQAVLDQINAQADAAEADRDAATVVADRLQDTADHRTDVDYVAVLATLASKKAELKALQDGVGTTTPAQIEEYTFLTNYGTELGVATT